MVASIQSEITDFLDENKDEKYRVFQAKLIPNIDSSTIIGVRTPALRSFAKKLAKDPDIDVFLETLPHQTFEENQLHAFMLGTIKDYDLYLEALEEFLPYIDNWATCDQLPVQKLADQPARTLESVQAWISDDLPYIKRFGVGVLLQLFLDERFDVEQMRWVAALKSDEYYVNMIRAWYVAEALVKQPEDALTLIESQQLDAWTHNKAIQKARESRRVSDEMKEYLNQRKLPK